MPQSGNATGFTATQDYTYNSLNRLTKAEEKVTPQGQTTAQASWEQTFGYDRFGNRTSFSQKRQAQPETVELPTIDSATNRITSANYPYDYNGNLIKDPEQRKFIFNADNKQVEVQSLDVNGNVTNNITRNIISVY